jgi:hypothetical protein
MAGEDKRFLKDYPKNYTLSPTPKSLETARGGAVCPAH